MAYTFIFATLATLIKWFSLIYPFLTSCLQILIIDVKLASCHISFISPCGVNVIGIVSRMYPWIKFMEINYHLKMFYKVTLSRIYSTCIKGL